MDAHPKPCFVLATFFPRPAIWSYYDNVASAEADRHIANRHDADCQYEAMSEAEYLGRQRRFYLRRPLEEVSQDQFDEKLNVLTPCCYGPRDGVLSFHLSEAMAGTFHPQYAARNGRFFTRIVDVRDRSTWITADEIDREFPTFAAREEDRRRVGRGR